MARSYFSIRFILLCAWALSFSCLSAAQNLPVLWQNLYGGLDNDAPVSVINEANGGYLIAGTSQSVDWGNVWGNHGFTDIWLLKLNSSGDTVWERCYGGTGSDIIQGKRSLLATLDGGYIFAGSTSSRNGDITDTIGGGDAWIVKLDENGSIQWQKCLGGTDWESAYGIIQQSDSSYIFTGITLSNNGHVSGNHGSSDAWLVHLDKNGSIIWQKCLGGSGNDLARDILTCNDGNYLIAGTTSSSNGDVTGFHGPGYADIWLVKMHDSTVLWQKCIGSYGNDYLGSIAQKAGDPGYYMCATIFNTDGDFSMLSRGQDMCLVKLDSAANILWAKNYGGSKLEWASAAADFTTGGYLLLGSSYSGDGDVTVHYGDSAKNDVWLVKTDDTGALQWQQTMGGTNYDNATTLLHTADGAYLAAMSTTSVDDDLAQLYHNSPGLNDEWIIKFYGFETALPQVQAKTTNHFDVYPTLCDHEVHIRYSGSKAPAVSLYNIFGQQFAYRSFAQGLLILGDIPSGIYYLCLSEGNTKEVHKLIISQ